MEISNMRINDNKVRPVLTVFAVVLMLALSACGAGNANATPTLSVDAIFTAAFQTLSAQQATQLALTPPTDTPLPTALPSLTPLPTQPGGLLFVTSTNSSGVVGTGCKAAYVNDVTIPDGTVIEPGKSFVKTWTLLNNGTCDWSTAFKFAFISGDAMNGTSVTIPSAVPAGQQAKISVTLTAPTATGNYKGYWRMETDQGQYFGDSPWVAITVSGAGTTTSTSATATNTSAAATNTTAAATNTPSTPTPTPVTPTKTNTPDPTP
jgi:hypothetical protein